MERTQEFSELATAATASNDQQPQPQQQQQSQSPSADSGGAEVVDRKTRVGRICIPQSLFVIRAGELVSFQP
jgi:hypothetical protein